MEDIYNITPLAEFTVSRLFALGVSNYLSVSFFMQNVLSAGRTSFTDSHSKNLNFQSGPRDTFSLSPAGRLSAGGTEM